VVDFDRVIERRHTGSFKWDSFPEDVVPLWVADMDFASPPAVIAALEHRAAHGVYGYARVPDSLIVAFQEYAARHYGWRVESDWLVWLPSVVPGLNLACRAFAEPGEAVLTITPVYPPFLEAPPAQGRRLQTVAARAEEIRPSGPQPARTHGGHSLLRWNLPLAEMEAAVTPDTRVLLFCHPHNPLGRVWSRAEVAAVVDFCARHGLTLVSDEIHCDLLLDPLEHVPAVLAHPGAGERTVTLMSPSKTFNLPGLNFAFAIIPNEELRHRFVAAGEGLLPMPGCFALAAAEAAYREGQEWLDELLAYLRGNRVLVERFVADSLPAVSMTHVEATYLAWLDVRACGREDPARACLEAGVALSDGAEFGAPGFLRLNFACPRAQLEEGLRRLQRALG